MLKPWRLIWLVLILLTALALPASAQQERLDLGIITVRQKALAEKLRKEISGGADFSALAKENSIGPTASRGGKLGKVPLSRLRPEYREAVKGLKPGVPSQVVPTEGGFNILYIFPIQKAKPKPQPKPKPKPAKVPEQLKVDTTLPPHLQARQVFSQALEFIAAGEFDKGNGLIDETLTKNPQDQGALLFKAALNDTQGDETKRNSLRTMALGVISLQTGDLEDALNQFKKAQTANTDLWQALVLHANVMANLGQMDQAMGSLKQAILINPKSDDAYASLGTIARELNQVEQAKRYLNEALNLNPKASTALYQLGAIAMDEQKHQDAERYFKSCLAVDPYNFTAHNDLGLIFALTGRLQEAETAYRASIKANPAYAPAHLNLGNLYASQDNFNQAIEEYNKALALDPTLAEAHNNLAASYVLLEDWPMAIMHADKALSMNFPVAEVVLRKVAPHR